MTDEELKFVKQLHIQIERVQKSVVTSGGATAEEQDDDAGTFMTRISEDGQGSRKGDGVVEDYDQPVNKSVILPNLSIKSPTSRQFHGHSTEDSFLSAAPKSVGSSRNTRGKQFYSQSRHTRALSNAKPNRASMYR